MTTTDFGAQKVQNQRAWAQDTIRVFRDESFWIPFMGSGENSIIQVANEMKKVRGADRAMFTLIQDLQSTGVVGDNNIRGNEEHMVQANVEVRIDHLRQAVINAGKMDDQRTVIDFRTAARDNLGAWRARTFDELLFETASGVGYDLTTDGAVRTIASGQTPLSSLSFAADVTAPTANRNFNATATGVVPGNTAVIDATSYFTYKTLLAVQAKARVMGIKPLTDKGSDYYVLVLHPYQMMQLKADADFNRNVVQGAERGDKNPIFTGAVVTMDGLVLKHSNRVVNTRLAAAGSKWGTGGLVDGARALLLGKQALLVSDLWGDTAWSEQEEDYGNRNGISIGMMFGMKKPVFFSAKTNSTEDFGVMVINSFIAA